MSLSELLRCTSFISTDSTKHDKTSKTFLYYSSVYLMRRSLMVFTVILFQGADVVLRLILFTKNFFIKTGNSKKDKK